MNKNTLIWIRAILATLCPACIGIATALVFHGEVVWSIIVYVLSIIFFVVTVALEKKDVWQISS